MSHVVPATSPTSEGVHALRRGLSLRRCVGCRRKAPRDRLVHFVADAGVVRVDPLHRGRGRGLSLCPTLRCAARAVKRRGFERAFGATIRGADAADIKSGLAHALQSLVTASLHGALRAGAMRPAADGSGLTIRWVPNLDAVPGNREAPFAEIPWDLTALGGPFSIRVGQRVAVTDPGWSDRILFWFLRYRDLVAEAGDKLGPIATHGVASQFLSVRQGRTIGSRQGRTTRNMRPRVRSATEQFSGGVNE